MLIQPRLKGVDGAEGAHLLDEVIAVLRQELGSVVPEEIPGVGLGQQLHGLGVDLRQVRTQARIVRHRLAADGEIPLEPVAQLVGVYGDVAGGAVAVGKDEGHPVGGSQQVVADHLVEKRTCLRAEAVIHPAGGPGQLLRRHRHGVALREHQGPVIGHQRVHPQAPALLLLQPQIQGGDMGLHLAAERVQLRPAIAQTLHAEIAVVGKIVKAVFTGQLISGMDQLPQDVLQLSGVFQRRLLLGLVGGPAARPVGAGQCKAQLTAAEGLALDLIPGGGRQLLVLGRQPGDAGL